MLIRTEAIVLTTQRYGEADLIVTYLTSDKGVLKAFAKSPRKTKSRFGSSLEPLTHARISLWGKEQSSVPRITQSDIIHPFHRIRENYQDFIHVSRLIETLLSLTPAEVPSKKLFAFFLSILQFIHAIDHESKDTLHLISRIRLLALLGYAPRLLDCGRCGRRSLDFYPDAGTTLCRNCAARNIKPGMPFIRISSKTIQFYTHSIRWPMHIVHRLKPQGDTLSELSVILERHITHILSKKLRTSEFF